MSEGGFLYILINPSLVGLVKIGKTSRDPELRAQELSQATGVATPFYVAYSLHFADIDVAERYLHTLLELQGVRLTANREFFQIPLQKAIELMMGIQANLPPSSEGKVSPRKNVPSDNDRSEVDSSDLNRLSAREIWEKARNHLYGYEDATQDTEEALQLFEQARELDFAPAYTSLADYYSNRGDDMPRAMEYLKEGAMRGHGRCFLAMASLFKKRGRMENFAKCWKRYLTGETFLRDDDMEWAGDDPWSDEGGYGLRRIDYIELYLDQLSHDNAAVPADIQAILAPFRDELIGSIKSSISRWTEDGSESGLRFANEKRILLEYVSRQLPMNFHRSIPPSSEGEARHPPKRQPDNDLSDIDFSDFIHHPGCDVFRQAIDHILGFGDALQDTDEGLRLLDAARKLDFPAAYTELAKFYSERYFLDKISGRNKSEDISRAMGYLKEGASRGHGRCYVEMALLFNHLGQMENSTKCWKRYFTGQTFLHDDDTKWTGDIGVAGGYPRIFYIGLYLQLVVKSQATMSPDTRAILAPFRDQIIAETSSSIQHLMKDASEPARRSVSTQHAVLEYVSREL
jgi:hypothetical protein